MKIKLYSKGEKLSTLLAKKELIRGIYCDSGKCGKCKVKILRGTKFLSPLTREEENKLSVDEIKQGVRLACMVELKGNTELELDYESSSIRLQDETLNLALPLETNIVSQKCSVKKPTIEQPIDDLATLKNSINNKFPYLQEIKLDTELIKQLPSLLRENNWSVEVVLRRSGEVVDVVSKINDILGLVIDLGTTKVAIKVVDLNTGEDIASETFLNPLLGFGEDVLTRAAYALQNKDHGFDKILWDKIESNLSILSQDYKFEIRSIYEVFIVCNTIMHHILMGIDLDGIVFSPYVPAVKGSLVNNYPYIKRINNNAFYTLPPVLGEFIGSDALSVAMSVDLERFKGLALVIDIGTNTEVILGGDKAGARVLACSTASGPAFEGANIKYGMRAETGAIETIKIKNGKFNLTTVDNQKPRGFCGSGIVDLVAELKRSNVVDRFGKIVDNKEIEVAPGIFFNQKDLENVLTAKAAIRVGIEMLLEDNGISFEQVDKIFVAGAFGNYLNIENAIAIGLFPEFDLNKFILIGNGALAGAKGMLLNHTFYSNACELAQNVETISLSSDKRFSSRFGQSMLLP